MDNAKGDVVIQSICNQMGNMYSILIVYDPAFCPSLLKSMSVDQWSADQWLAGGQQGHQQDQVDFERRGDVIEREEGISYCADKPSGRV